MIHRIISMPDALSFFTSNSIAQPVAHRMSELIARRNPSSRKPFASSGSCPSPGLLPSDRNIIQKSRGVLKIPAIILYWLFFYLWYGYKLRWSYSDAMIAVTGP